MTSNVIVTGFGPFGEHKTNASWESVQLLPDEIEGHKIQKYEIPVAYDEVNTKIQNLWKEHQPKLVVHVGVSKLADKLTLEKCAYLQGYDRQDVFGNCPEKGQACPSNCADAKILVGLDLKQICDGLNEGKKIKACLSEDAGRYLCEYIHYTSLSVNKDRAMFIHVPMLDQPYTAQQLAEGIEEVIRLALKQCSN